MANFINEFMYTYFIILSFAPLHDAKIYMKPLEGIDEDNSYNDNLMENSNENNYLFVILPHRLLRSELPAPLEVEPYRTIKHERKISNTTKDTLEDLKLTKQQTDMLRKSWRYSCDKKAAKICKKACINTYKIVCSAYLCKKGMKRSFKRECKRNCKGRFVNRRSDSE